MKKLYLLLVITIAIVGTVETIKVFNGDTTIENDKITRGICEDAAEAIINAAEAIINACMADDPQLMEELGKGVGIILREDITPLERSIVSGACFFVILYDKTLKNTEKILELLFDIDGPYRFDINAPIPVNEVMTFLLDRKIEKLIQMLITAHNCTLH
jgi:hypothetical protein